MITPRVNFEKQFGEGVDPWYAKAERWANKQKFPISFLLKGFISFLKERWIDVKVENTMRSVDADVEKIHELWDDEEKKQFAPEIIETPSEVEGLNDLMIGPRDDIDFYGY